MGRWQGEAEAWREARTDWDRGSGISEGVGEDSQGNREEVRSSEMQRVGVRGVRTSELTRALSPEAQHLAPVACDRRRTVPFMSPRTLKHLAQHPL